MTTKEYQHQQYLKRRAAIGAEEIRRRNRESYERNKEKTLARGRERYLKNREKIIARTSDYHKRNPDIARKSAANYAYRHPDRVKATQLKSRIKSGGKAQRAYYWRNRDRLLPILKSKRDRNKSAYRKYQKEWRARNKHYVNVVKPAMRRAREKHNGVDSTSISKFVNEVRSKLAVKCFWCETRFPGKYAQIDHIVPIAKGGRHSIENLCVACATCNHKKGAKDLISWNLSKSNPQLVLI